MDRDLALERLLVTIAAGQRGDLGLLTYAQTRALPGPVRLPRDWDREIREEIADGVNYACWAVQEIYDQALDGDPAVTDQYQRHMRCLAHLVNAWHALNT